MKTASGGQYEYVAPSARPVDLGERLVPVIDNWILDGNIQEGMGGFTVLVLMDNPMETTHRIRVEEAAALRACAAQEKVEMRSVKAQAVALGLRTEIEDSQEEVAAAFAGRPYIKITKKFIPEKE